MYSILKTKHDIFVYFDKDISMFYCTILFFKMYHANTKMLVADSSQRYHQSYPLSGCLVPTWISKIMDISIHSINW